MSLSTRLTCPQKDHYYVALFPPLALPNLFSTVKLSDCVLFVNAPKFLYYWLFYDNK